MSEHNKQLGMFFKCVEFGVKINKSKHYAVICTQGIGTFNVTINSPTDTKTFNADSLIDAGLELAEIYFGAMGMELEENGFVTPRERLAIIGIKLRAMEGK